MLLKSIKRLRRKKRIRSKIVGTKERPRLSIFRSNFYIFAQLIDDAK
jgi:large subunit ribosomal protein L18